MSMTKLGTAYKFGDVILAEVQFIEKQGSKTRPSLVLFEEYGNIVAAAITSNPYMKGISLTQAEGAQVDSTIKLNYIFTITKPMVKSHCFQ